MVGSTSLPLLKGPTYSNYCTREGACLCGWGLITPATFLQRLLAPIHSHYCQSSCPGWHPSGANDRSGSTPLRHTASQWSYWRCGSTHRWRMVGLPCGQFQGERMVDRCSRMARMVLACSALPIMMEERQARDASIARTLQKRRSCG